MTNQLVRSTVASTLHETLLRLFRSRTTLAPELITRVFGAELPDYTRATTGEADFTQTVTTEYRADLLILLQNQKPVYAIVIEVQLARDSRKRFTWPLYVAAVRDRHQCPASVLVVTPNESIAEWAREPVALGVGSTFQPIVVGPASVPLIVSSNEAARAPELAVLSALAHGRRSSQTVFAALAGLDSLAPDDIHYTSI